MKIIFRHPTGVGGQSGPRKKKTGPFCFTLISQRKFYRVVQKSKYKSIERLTFECANILEKKYKLKKVFIKVIKVEVAIRYGCESISVSK